MEDSQKEKPFRFRQHTWNQIKKSKPALIALYVIAMIAVVALLAPLLANDRPLYAKYYGKSLFPAFSFKKIIEVKTASGTEQIILDVADWKHMQLDAVVWAPVPYSPGKSDYLNANFVSPGGDQKFLKDSKVINMPWRFRHWMGTGVRGNDVLSGLIHGARISLTIGFIAMGIATVIGIIIGMISGYFGDHGIFITRAKLYALLIGSIVAWFYAFQLRAEIIIPESIGGILLQSGISLLIFVMILFLFYQIGKVIGRIRWLNRKISFPADSVLSRVIEILVSLPVLLIIITIAAISKPSIVNVMVIIGAISWTGIARLTRAEMLRIRQLDYIESARALGFPSLRILWKHALPNALAPSLIAVSFGVAGAILIESSLSFLGVGVPQDLVTWGSLINSGRINFKAWWIIVFPGICILLTVLSYNLLGEALRDALDPKLKE